MISVTVLTYNAEETLEQCLQGLRSFPEVVILDTGSIDKSLEIAKKFSNTKVFFTPFIGFGPLHNLATSHATHDWILSIDADEVVTEALAAEINRTTLAPKCIYMIPLRNYFQGKWIAGCGWHPNYKRRLYNRKETRFSDDAIHESILMEGFRVIKFREAALHFSYRKVGHFLQKMENYSELFAEQYRGKKKSSLTKAIVKSWVAFFKSYILKKGFLLGREGYIISRYQADVAYYKYLKLDEKNLSLHI